MEDNKIIIKMLKEKFQCENDESIKIEIPAKKYFKFKFKDLRKVKKDDYCIIIIDFKDKISLCAWLNKDEDPNESIYEEEDFKETIEILKELYL